MSFAYGRITGGPGTAASASWQPMMKVAQDRAARMGIEERGAKRKSIRGIHGPSNNAIEAHDSLPKGFGRRRASSFVAAPRRPPGGAPNAARGTLTTGLQ